MTYGVWYCGGTGIALLALVLGDGLRCDLWCLILWWDWNWAYCCCIIGRVSEVTYGVWYYGGTSIGLIVLVYGDGLRCDLSCLVLWWDWN